MANKWSVTTERLVSSAGVIEEKTARYNSEWAKLYTELQSLKSAQWQGIASDTFNAKLEAYRNDFEEMAYDECKLYMTGAVNTLHKNKKTHKSEQWKDYEAEASAIRTLLFNKGHFYRNNIFVFLLHMLIWGVPIFGVIAYFIMQNGDTDAFFKTFGIAFGVVMGIVIFVAFCKYISNSKTIPYLVKTCQLAESKLANDKVKILLDETRTVQVSELYNKFISNPEQTIEEIAMSRSEFELVYEGSSQEG